MHWQDDGLVWARDASEPADAQAPRRALSADGTGLAALRARAVWLAQHVLPHERALRAWLTGKLSAGLDLDDVVQETYAVLSALESIEHIRAPRAYAFQVAWSINTQHARRAGRAPVQALDTFRFDPPDPEPSPEQAVTAREALRNTAAIIARLPARCREAFLLRRLDGLSQREISERMGIAESTVEKHLARALRMLIQALREDDGPSLFQDPAPALLER